MSSKRKFFICSLYLLLQNIADSETGLSPPASNSFHQIYQQPSTSSSARSVRDHNLRNATNKRSIRLPRDQYSSAYAYAKVPKNYAVIGQGWNPRQMQMASFAPTNLVQSQQNPTNEFTYAGGYPSILDDDNSVAADSQGGWGWGWGMEGKGCNSALGLLGVLGLAAYLQNILQDIDDDDDVTTGNGNGGGSTVIIHPPDVNTKGKGKGRTKRSQYTDFYLPPRLDEIETPIIPYLFQLNKIREESLPAHCSSYPICMISELMSHGLKLPERKSVQKILSSIIGKTFHLKMPSFTKPNNPNPLNEFKHLIEFATHVGSSNAPGKCNKTFKDCSHIKAEKSKSV